LNNPDVSHQSFLFIDKWFETSNLDLVKDMADMIETLEEFS